MTSLDVHSSLLKRRTNTVERRTASRLPQVGTARVSPPNATGYFAGYATTVAGVPLHLRNISRGGVGFNCSQSLDPGKTYTLEMHLNWMKNTAAVRVIWCRPCTGGGGFEGGGEFC